MKVITETYLMKVITETYLMKVITETYLMKVITETYLMKVITETCRAHKIRYLHLCQIFDNIRVITKLPNSEQSYKGKVKTHKYINRQNQSTTGKL